MQFIGWEQKTEMIMLNPSFLSVYKSDIFCWYDGCKSMVKIPGGVYVHLCAEVHMKKETNLSVHLYKLFFAVP